MLTTITRPARYQADAWLSAEYPTSPVGYSGIKFDFSVVEQCICLINDECVELLGVRLPVTNTQFELEGLKDPNYPIYFVVLGRRFNYTFSIWEDRVEIEVGSKGEPERGLSCMFPVTEDQFRQALATVIADSSPDLVG